MIRFSEQKWPDVRGEILALWPAHYAEVYRDDDYAPDIERYDQMASVGILKVVAARRGAQLVGYVVAMITPHLHSAKRLWAFYDSYYLLPDCRGPGVFDRMLEESERIFQEAGATRHFIASPKHAAQGLEKRGWTPAENTYIKKVA